MYVVERGCDSVQSCNAAQRQSSGVVWADGSCSTVVQGGSSLFTAQFVCIFLHALQINWVLYELRPRHAVEGGLGLGRADIVFFLVFFVNRTQELLPK